MEWIKCSERLPEKPNIQNYEQVACLVFIPREGIYLLLWNCEHLVWDDEDGDDVSRYNGKATHWMPLPEPPTE